MSTLPGTPHRRRIYLLRHGAVEYFDRGGVRVPEPRQVGLTEEGREQAAAMASALAGIGFDRAVHTGLPRTRETAELVLGGREGPSLEAMPDLMEIETGPIDELPADRVEDEFTYGFENARGPGACFARGEPFADFYARVSTGVEALLGADGWSRLLLVAHGGTNRAILSWMIRGGLDTLALFEQDECCLNVIDLDILEGEAVRRYVRVVNMTPYNLVKEGQYLTTLERVIAHRDARKSRSPEVD